MYGICEVGQNHRHTADARERYEILVILTNMNLTPMVKEQYELGRKIPPLFITVEPSSTPFNKSIHCQDRWITGVSGKCTSKLIRMCNDPDHLDDVGKQTSMCAAVPMNGPPIWVQQTLPTIASGIASSGVDEPCMFPGKIPTYRSLSSPSTPPIHTFALVCWLLEDSMHLHRHHSSGLGQCLLQGQIDLKCIVGMLRWKGNEQRGTTYDIYQHDDKTSMPWPLILEKSPEYAGGRGGGAREQCKTHPNTITMGHSP
ncbi:uncharacterized protein EI90DRAFT_3019936 [Cantharellus anzutake]|uniref:uncharacterized protein n=1 Tax=Cantharellus anzutake TaxID=1750568 RepID=UPI0019058A85|nr:uncharacterized protein EI90DRAFT_3019936 [Cantharellus anzutake]KAF8322944.1 hypothetical protein EI90DRAFT_3019936 [Cantharellus anzutake]